MNNWMDEIEVNDKPADVSTGELNDVIVALRAAGALFDTRTDSFAQGKGDTCRDIASKLAHYSAFASSKQEDFARKLITWAQPRESVKAESMAFPNLFAAMQKLADLRLPGVKLSRKNQSDLVWVLQGENTVAGKMETPAYIPFYRRVGSHGQRAILAAMHAAESDPVAAAIAYGRESGRCAVCGRDLTDPESIAAGIGPICAGRLA